MEAQDDPGFQTILNQAFLCTPDGMPMVWVGKLNGHRGNEPRLRAGLDAGGLRVERKKSGCRHFFYGGADGVAELLAEKLRAKFPELKVAGTFTPPFRPLNAEEEKKLQEHDPRREAGHFMGRLKHAETGKIHGGISAEAGRDADDRRRRGI